jgi:hypothetical protein
MVGLEVGVPSVIGARALLEMDNDSWETNTTKTGRSRMQAVALELQNHNCLLPPGEQNQVHYS